MQHRNKDTKMHWKLDNPVTHTHAHTTIHTQRDAHTHTYAYIDNVFGELINTQREERCQQQ